MATVTLRPAGVGGSSTNDAVGDTPNWKCVDDVTSDSDTTYVSCPTNTSRIDLYTIDSNSIGASDTINSVTVYAVAYRTAGRASSGNIYMRIVENAITTEGGANNLGASYATFSTTWTTRPSDGGAFTKTDIDSLQIGFNIFSGLTNTCRTTQVYVIIDYTPAAGTSIKTIDGLAIASVKTKNSLAIASVKSVNGVSNT